MVDESEARNGHGYDLNCSMGPTTEGTDNDEGGLLLDGSSGGVSFGEGTSAEKSKIIYKRRKRRKMSSSDEKTMTEFSDKVLKLFSSSKLFISICFRQMPSVGEKFVYRDYWSVKGNCF